MASISTGADFGTGAKQKGQFDIWLLLSAAGLLLVGLMSIYSVGVGRGSLSFFRQQVVNTVIGIVPFTVMLVVPVKFWSRLSGVVYAANVLALIAVLVIGKSKNGSERWIQIGSLPQFQPSEAAKLLFVLSLAAFFASRQTEIRKVSTVLLSLVHLIIPMLLIMKQPHYGAAAILGASWFAIALLAGVPGKQLAAIIGSLVLFVGVLFFVPNIREKVLKGYHLNRIEAFSSQGSEKGTLDREQLKKQRDKMYQANQAAIAFGLGGVAGSGYLKGAQKESRLIPEQHNDFVFTVPGEEAGLIGCTLIIALFSFFFYRVWLIALYAKDPFCRMVTGGLFAVFVFHTFINIGMVVGIMPVIGLWLPFISYGGTALWLCMASVGLLLNIRRNEAPILF